ncbi:uncharacterized protein LOC117295440 isoform X2 [Asterias rubens]|uniref:uncharacterized protein LOC117295440 isoform X2 n=1 Tax=Asterias rubens TaxID=7604 RepID=UPI0014557B40|nr:uncharacterized protein LOC117295440 isoform X2 [Asterias rubens]
MSFAPMMTILAAVICVQCVTYVSAVPLLQIPKDESAVRVMYQNGPVEPNRIVDLVNLMNSMQLNDASSCACSDKTCGCCQQIKIKELDINSQACVNVTFLSTQLGVKLSLSVGGKVLFDKTVSIKNPGPVCVKLGENKFGAELCVELYNIAVSLADMQACARLEGKVFSKTVATVDLGCFKIPFKASELLGAGHALDLTNLLNSMQLNDASSCACSDKTCGCCQQIKIKELDINSQACVNVTFLSTQLGVKLSLSVGGKVLFDKTVSIKNPGPVCVKLGENKFGAELCVELYNIAVSLADMQACARLEGKVFSKTVATVDLGCFKIPFKASELLGAGHALDLTNLLNSMQLNDASSCACSDKTCGCCQQIKIKELDINSQACVNVTFLSTQLGVKLSLSVGGKVLFDKTVSIKNPGPVCVKLGENKFGAELCVELYNIAVSLADMQACARLEGKVFSKTVATVDLGCFKIPFKASELLGAGHALDLTNLLNSMQLNDASSCACSDKTCGCCQQIKIKELDINSQACVNVTFLSTQLGVKLSLSVGGKVLFDKTVSIKNPGPVCVKLGENKFGAELCVELYNIAVSLADMQACARLEGKVFSKTVATVDLGCFKIPFKASELLGAGHALDWTHLMNSMQLNDASSCACSDKTCGCCQQIKIKELHIHSKACVNVTFLSTQLGVKLSLSVGGKVLFKKTVSIKNPGPVCVNLGESNFGAKLCVELYNIAVSLADMQACVRLEGKVLSKTVAKVDLGCFKIPFKASELLGAGHALDWTHLMNSMQLNDASSCACSDKTCGCCQQIKIKELHIHSKACVNVTFLSTQLGVKLSLSVGGKVLFKKTVSIKNPGPVCVNLGESNFGAKLCVELYNIAVSLADMQACVRLEGKVLSKTVAKVDLGCFKIPFKGSNTLEIPISQEVGNQ